MAVTTLLWMYSFTEWICVTQILCLYFYEYSSSRKFRFFKGKRGKEEKKFHKWHIYLHTEDKFWISYFNTSFTTNHTKIHIRVRLDWVDSPSDYLWINLNLVTAFQQSLTRLQITLRYICINRTRMHIY